MRAWVTMLLAAGLLTMAGCGSAADDADARRQLDAAGDQVVGALNEVVPVIGRQLRAKLTSGYTEWESCTLPVAGDARAQAHLQFGGIEVPKADGVTRLAAALEGAGWKVTADPAGSIEAHRAGLQLDLALQGIVQTAVINTGCIKTSKRVDSEYDGRPERHLPTPWPESGIS